MLNNIAPPLDNLYKFMAISGLILFGYTSYLFFTASHELNQKILNNEHEKRISEIEYKSLINTMKATENKQKKFQSWFDCVDYKNETSKFNEKLFDTCNEKLNVNPEEVISMHYEIDKDVVLFKEKRKALSMKDNEITYKSNQIKLLNDELNKFITLKYSLLLLSIFLIFSGFFLWYVKHQKYQDMIIKNAAKIPSNETTEEHIT